MTSLSRFKCVLQTRKRTLLECMANSVVVPGVEGQMGIMRGHCPMLSEIGLGIMTAKGLSDFDYNPLEDRHFLLDGGFVRIADNNVAVIAYDVTGFDEIPMEKVDEMVEKAKNLLEGDKFTQQIRSHEIKKAEMILRLAELAKYSSDGSNSTRQPNSQ
ncbi:F0F1 ATP synthase subunit epsilon [Sedimentisphaera salicampi]|uniref:F0F1 ATP synthase subunit epsilon n=1 Tax=Sedimentisphaera salicampi TaxID=1941349 RepID=UPI000B9B52A8|nr:F0F1 ATP synthase subunit epsilon [Sedimentisphaera salicampi]OXU15708.1 Na(+)-translocating ATPase subunit epsilon [Sedimentisphaera salicampi]